MRQAYDKEFINNNLKPSLFKNLSYKSIYWQKPIITPLGHLSKLLYHTNIGYWHPDIGPI